MHLDVFKVKLGSISLGGTAFLLDGPASLPEYCHTRNASRAALSSIVTDLNSYHLNQDAFNIRDTQDRLMPCYQGESQGDQQLGRSSDGAGVSYVHPDNLFIEVCQAVSILEAKTT